MCLYIGSYQGPRCSPSGFLIVPVMCLDVLLSLCYFFFPRARFLFLTAPIFSSYSAEFYCFSRTPAWFLSPCQLPGWQSLHLIDLEYHFFSPTQELVNGSWCVSIVRINDFLYLCHGAGDRCQVAQCHFSR